ncbi:MAG: shikimate dehydrogenase family protein [Candidatus Muiribacteriaceae bacterium]
MEIKEVAGINITFPFKKEAMQNCPHRKSARAYAIGGINIVYCGDSGEAFCDNTDGEGFCRFLSRHDIEPESILLLGTGITSRSILYSLRENNIKCLSVCTRDKSGIYDSDFFSSRDICIREYGDIHPGDYELIINTTPVGFDSLGLKTEDYCGRLFEVKYSEPTCAEYNGIELLIEQALVNFRLFTGYDVDNRYWELKKYLSGVN